MRRSPTILTCSSLAAAPSSVSVASSASGGAASMSKSSGAPAVVEATRGAIDGKASPLERSSSRLLGPLSRPGSGWIVTVGSTRSARATRTARDRLGRVAQVQVERAARRGLLELLVDDRLLRRGLRVRPRSASNIAAGAADVDCRRSSLQPTLSTALPIGRVAERSSSNARSSDGSAAAVGTGSRLDGPAPPQAGRESCEVGCAIGRSGGMPNGKLDVGAFPRPSGKTVRDSLIDRYLSLSPSLRSPSSSVRGDVGDPMLEDRSSTHCGEFDEAAGSTARCSASCEL